MPGEVSVRFTGGKELQRALRRLPERVERKVARQALRMGAKVYQKELRNQLPRSVESDDADNVHLADSVKIVRPRDARQKLVIRVGVAGPARQYAHIIEYGNSEIAAQPVWRPVFRRKAQAVIRKVAAKLGVDIIKEVRRGN